MTLAHMIILLATGAGVGFISSLLGVGGGFIMTPVQYAIYLDMGIPADIAIKLAFGTNLLVILPTAASGAWRHSRKGAVLRRPAVIIGTSSVIAAFGGATLASYLPAAALKIVFGAVVILSAIRMIASRMPHAEEPPVEKSWILAAWAIPIGLLTGVIGIGGGVLMIPVMVLALRFKIHQAVATSLAVMTVTSIGGIIGYIVNGIGTPGLPPFSIGYVNLHTWLLLVVSSVVMAQVGAMTAHRMPARWLRFIFIALMFYVGLRMAGFFDWLGWPI